MRVSKERRFLLALRTSTVSAHEYFAGATSDLRLFHFIIDTVLVGDYVAHVAKQALDSIDAPETKATGVKWPSPVELAKTAPGPRTKALRKQRQPLLEMFFARSVDNFNRYLVDLVRIVLRKQPAMLNIAQADSSIPSVLLAVLVFWIAVIFLSFGLFAPRNATVLAALLVCAMSVSGSIFLLLELNSPFDGAIRISSAPMRDALARLGR